jgi:hypothetical protein
MSPPPTPCGTIAHAIGMCPFFDAYLRGHKKAYAWLKGADIAKATPGKVTLESK